VGDYTGASAQIRFIHQTLGQDRATVGRPGAAHEVVTVFAYEFPMFKSSTLAWTSRATALLIAVAVATAVYIIVQLRLDSIRDAYTETGNIASLLSQQLYQFSRTIDVVLSETKRNAEEIDSYSRKSWRDALSSRGFREILLARLHTAPQVFNIAIADENGQVLSSTASWPAPAINVADRDYFKLAQSAGNEWVVSAPIASRVDGRHAVVFSKALRGSFDEFTGIAYVVVNLDYFSALYEGVRPLTDVTVTLARPDGVMMARFPKSKFQPGDLLQKNSGFYDAVKSGGGTFRSVSDLDGEVRLVSLRLVQEAPLAITVTVLERNILARWSARAIGIAIAVGFFVLCAVTLLGIIASQIKKLAASRADLQATNIRFDAALNNMSQGLLMTGFDQRIVVANSRYAEIYRLQPDQVAAGVTMSDLAANRQLAGTASLRCEPQSEDAEKCVELEVLPDGRLIAVTHEKLADGSSLSTHEDVTERQAREAQISFMARHDVLTGLANRAEFLENLESALARLARGGPGFAILTLDLDRFKQINDCYGHPAGDALLKETGFRLRSALRSTDIIARLGGDEFAILQYSDGNPSEGADALARKIIGLISEPYLLDGNSASVGASIGIALAPDHGVTREGLMKNSDLALYKSKTSGRNTFNIYSHALRAEAESRNELENDLREAVWRDEFELHYQPIVEIDTGRICTLEALVRWRHPRNGLTQPAQFIPLAEETGLIIQLSEWILHRACQDAATLPEGIKIAVNLSPIQFEKSNVVDVIIYALIESNLPPGRLEVEITEGVLLKGTEENKSVLAQLKNLGISIALDDFGVGYSSLGYLTAFPFDKIKIDKSFIESIDKPESKAVVASIIQLSHSLNLVTAAEGIETEGQLNKLRALGVRLAQGYFIGRPAPFADLDLAAVELRQESDAA
jgi:diguanylate cyclase (GGDEF)-like protein